MSSISTRKKDHIDLTLKDSSQYKRPTGQNVDLRTFRFVHICWGMILIFLCLYHQ